MSGVLVVDDTEDVRFLLRAALEGGGWEIHEAASGEEALSAFDACEPDVVVLDQQMPGLTGIEVAAQLLARGCPARIILFSAYLNRSIEVEAQQMGIAAVSKDRLGDLLAMIGEASAD